jgi:hypothetical protein
MTWKLIRHKHKHGDNYDGFDTIIINEEKGLYKYITKKGEEFVENGKHTGILMNPRGK